MSTCFKISKELSDLNEIRYLVDINFWNNYIRYMISDYINGFKSPTQFKNNHKIFNGNLIKPNGRIRDGMKD
jgi:hypothetical protein